MLGTEFTQHVQLRSPVTTRRTTRSTARLHAGASAAAVLLAACTDTPADPRPEPGRAVSAPTVTAVAAAPERFMGVEREFAEVAAAVPEFAGYRYDPRSGELVVAVTDSGRGAAAASAVVSGLQRRGRLAGAAARAAGAPRVARVKYTFLQLADWRDSVRGSAPAGTRRIDLDEERNMVSVGVADEAGIARVRELARRAGLPSDALQVTILPATQLRQSPTPTGTSLRGRFRGVPGGVEIGWSTGSSCTMGINARWSGTYNVGLTASHCSKIILTKDDTRGSTSFFQPSAQITANRIGNEFEDPMYYTDGACPAGGACRYSDVLAVYYGPQTNTAYGRIAKPSGSPNYLAAGGSLSVAGYFHVVGDWGYSSVGEELQKVGRTTGWTRGYVTNSCVDQAGDFDYTLNRQVYIWCTDISDIHSDFGDSGSPIFKWYGPGSDDVYFAGILWGGPFSDLNVTYHSTTYGISRDFPNYIVNTGI